MLPEYLYDCIQQGLGKHMSSLRHSTVQHNFTCMTCSNVVKMASSVFSFLVITSPCSKAPRQAHNSIRSGRLSENADIACSKADMKVFSRPFTACKPFSPLTTKCSTLAAALSTSEGPSPSASSGGGVLALPAAQSHCSVRADWCSLLCSNQEVSHHTLAPGSCAMLEYSCSVLVKGTEICETGITGICKG